MENIEHSIKQLKQLQENLKKVEGTRTYTFKEIFNDNFISSHTKFQTISDFLNASGLDFSSQEAFRNIDIDKLDKYISENSDFNSWNEMKTVASNELISKEIMF